MLALVSLILLTACQNSLNSNACLIFDDIIVTTVDEELFLEYQNEFSYQFFLSLRNYKDTYKQQCQSLQTN